MDSLSVAILAHIFPSRPGSGGPCFVWEQVKALSALHRMCVVAPVPWCPPVIAPRRHRVLARLPTREDWSGTPVWRPRYPVLPRRALFALLPAVYVMTAGKWLARAGRRSDLIHAHFAYPDGVAAVWIGRRLGKPVVLTVHGSDSNEYAAHAFWRAQISWALARTAATIAGSRSLAARAVGLGAREQSMFVIPPPLDTEVFVPRDKHESRLELGLPEDLPIVLFVGRLDAVKAIHHLLQAVAILRERMQLRLVLVGEGPELKRLSRLAGDLRIAEAVHFAGAKSQSEVSLWMNAADLLALSSLSEGFGLALAESIACGRPVVGTRCGGPEEIITPDVGELVPPGDPEALSRAIADVLARLDSFNAHSMAERARDLWAPAPIANRITQVYEHCVRSGHA